MKRLHRPTSIRGKLALWLLAALALLSFISAHIGYRQYKAQRLALMRVQRQERESSAKLIAASLDSLVGDAIRSQKVAGRFLVQSNLAPGSSRRCLIATCRAHPSYISASYISLRGEVMASSDSELVGTNLSLLEDVESVLSGKAWTVSGAHRSSSKPRRFAISSAVYRHGYLAGVIRTEIRADSLGRILPPDMGQGTTALIIDRRGREVCLRAAAGLRIPREVITRADFVRKAVTRRVAGSGALSIRSGGPWVGCAAPTSVANWTVIAIQSTGHLLQEPLANFARGLYLSLGLTLAFLLLFWWRCGVWLGENMRRLTHGAAALAVGDLRKRIHVHTNDELEELASAFNRMAENLLAHERQIESKSAALKGLLDVAQVVSSSLDLEIVASAVSHAVNRRFGASAAALYLTCREDPEPELLVYNRYDEHSPEAPPEEWRRMARRARKENGPQTATEDEDIYSASRRILIGVPLVAGDEPTGVLVGGFPRDELADEDSLQERMDLLRVFASHAAAALRNAQTYAFTRDYSDNLATLLDELSALRYVTEAISSSLDLQEVLQTLARLTCDVVRAQACAIMMMDPTGVLTASESFNLSQEMRKRCQCRIGEPVSGVTAVERSPVAVRDIAERYPDLELAKAAASEGLHGCLSVPLITNKEVIGTIDVWMSQPCDFSPYQVDLLSSIAVHAAIVIQNARSFGKEYRIAETLQSVITGSMPSSVGGLKLGCKYAPALDEARVGGDFYDLIPLPGDKLGIVIADVSGKGLGAAMHTAMCKFMLRGFAYHLPDSPAKALGMVNDALRDYAGSRFFVTVFYGVIDPATGVLTYANAGHPPPIWVSEDGMRQTLLYQTGVPVGLDAGTRYEERSARLSDGDALVLYTDGLVDVRRGEDTLGIEGLQEILFAAKEQDPQAMVERLYTEALLYAKDGVQDDTVVVALRAVELGLAYRVESQPREKIVSKAVNET